MRRSNNEIIIDILLWIPTQARTVLAEKQGLIYFKSVDRGLGLEDLPGVMDDRDGC